MDKCNVAVDMEHLNQYTNGDLELEQEIFGLFREQIQIWLKMLKVDADNEEWAAAAHSLKGSARGLGAHKLASACEAAEAVVLCGAAQRGVAAANVRQEVDGVLGFIDRREYDLGIQGLRNSSHDSNS